MSILLSSKVSRAKYIQPSCDHFLKGATVLDKKWHFDFTNSNSANSSKSCIIVIARYSSIIPKSFSEIGVHLCLLHEKTACKLIN